MEVGVNVTITKTAERAAYFARFFIEHKCSVWGLAEVIELSKGLGKSNYRRQGLLENDIYRRLREMDFTDIKFERDGPTFISELDGERHSLPRL